MIRPGTEAQPCRIAIVGSGPAGFYTAQHLLQQDHAVVEIDIFDRLPTPFGLVRHGVAPDHQKIKNVIAVYDKLARRPEVRFFGNVEYGTDVRLADLRRHYHQIVFATGAQTDRHLGIPGEDLAGSHSATDFVAWYNGHPDYVDRSFDLSCEAAVVIGVGNVAVDVARVLCRTPHELATTDIADYALDALRASGVRTVHLVGRRGPAQAAFTNPEIKELGELADTETTTLASETALDPLSRAALEQAGDKATARKVEILASYAERRQPGRSRRLIIRFLLSPVEIQDDGSGRVHAVRLVRNRLVATDGGGLRAEASEETELIRAGLVFRSVGYRGVALPELPFDERRGTVPHEAGRVLDPATGGAVPGLYVSGWIKRGPSGVIGTNKPDALETVRSMLDDLSAERVLRPERSTRAALESFVAELGVRCITYPDWTRLDALEVERGAPLGRPRLKFTRREEFLQALDD